MMDLGTLTLHRSNGDEVFGLSKAAIRGSRAGEDVVLFLYVDTLKKPIKTLPDTKGLRARPNADLTIRVTGDQFETLVGRRFSVPRSWDTDADDHVSCLYYCEHDDLNDNVIEIFERRGDAFRIRWTGTATDVNNVDGR